MPLTKCIKSRRAFPIISDRYKEIFRRTRRFADNTRIFSDQETRMPASIKTEPQFRKPSEAGSFGSTHFQTNCRIDVRRAFSICDHGGGPGENSTQSFAQLHANRSTTPH